jgi:predicted component of type VI protein secretion system
MAFGRVIVGSLSAGATGEPLDPHALLGDLPCWVTRDGGESRLRPCAEVVLSESAIGALADLGVTVLVPVRDTDEARFRGIQTVAGGAVRVG